jgi:hypothetical protein
VVVLEAVGVPGGAGLAGGEVSGLTVGEFVECLLAFVAGLSPFGDHPYKSYIRCKISAINAICC